MKRKNYFMLISISIINIGLCFAMEDPRGSKRTIGQAELENTEAQRARIEEAAQSGAVASSSSSSSSAHSPMEIDQPSALSSQGDLITIISSDGQEFNVSPDVANSFKTIKGMLSDFQEKPQVSLSEVDSKTLGLIIPLIQEYLQHKNTLENKELLDALENKLKELIEAPHTTSRNDTLFLTATNILKAANYLDQPTLIELAARIAAQQIINLNLKFDNWSKDIPQKDLHPTIAKYYYLLTGKNLPGVDPSKYGVSIRDLLDYNWKITIRGNRLDVSNVHINSLEGLSDIPNKEDINYIDLSNNQITTIANGAFTGLTHLKILILSHNQITSIPDGTLVGLTNLDEIDLSHNQITSIPKGAFACFTNLKGLVLSHNQITTIPDNAFANLTKLRYLDLSHNQITAIPDNAFAGLTNLEELFLFNNQIKTIAKGAFASFTRTRVRSIRLSNNNLDQNEQQEIRRNWPTFFILF